MKLIGTGSALPKKKVTNAMLSEFLDTSDEWIIPRTGIRSRHVISDENLEDLGAEAASKAIKMAPHQIQVTKGLAYARTIHAPSGVGSPRLT